MRHCPRCRAAFRTLRFCPRDNCPTVDDIEDPLIGSTLGGRYRILDVIASGGMGRVYRATHARIAALFAVKVLYGEMGQDDSLRSRFQREAEVASCMQSRHILRVFDFGESDEGLLYLAMEYLDGMSLSTRIVRDGALAPAKATALALQVARGLAHAHERGVIHRDLKSENVLLVTEDDEEDVVKLLDFGVARTRDATQLTQIGQIVGTPHYMAPEQFTGQPVDARADLYALGVLLFEMLTGELPFRGTSMIAMATQHATQAPGSVRARNPAVPPGLEAIVQKLLAKQPDDRFASARALLDALKEESAPPVPEPTTAPLERVVPWMGDAQAQRERRATASARVSPALDAGAVVERIRRTIQVGAPTYNSGDHLACYTLYRDTATELARGAAEAGAVAVSARLRVALQRAAIMEPTPAAWEMRHAFDDLLGAAGSGGLNLAGSDAPLQREIANARAISERRYAAGGLDIVGDYYLELTRQLSTSVRAAPGLAALQPRLDEAVAAAEQAGGGQRALADLSALLDALAAGSGGETDLDMPRAPVGLNACPKLPELQRRAVSAIAGGAPAYNAGDPLACYRIFRRATQEILGAVDGSPASGPVAELMRAALEQANAVPVERAVWILRHALDDLVAAR